VGVIANSETIIYKHLILNTCSLTLNDKTKINENYIIKFGNSSNYGKVKRIAGESYEGINLITKEKILMKYIVVKKLSELTRQIKILEEIGGKNNIIQLIDVINNVGYKKRTALIFEYVDNNGVSSKTLFKSLSDFEARYYMYEMLKAINYINSMGIYHRDLHARNFVIDHS